MASLYPGALDTTTNLPDNITDNSPLNSPDHATLHNTVSDAVIALEHKLGTGTGSLPALGDVLTGTGSGSADWFPASTSAIFNVKTYGATGNGSTDDTAALQAAIDAAQAAGGGTVYLPAGTYKTTAALKLYSGNHPTITAYTNIAIQGAGAQPGAGSRIVQHTTGADCIKGINDSSNSAQSLNLTFSNFSMAFSGTATNSGNGIYLSQFGSGGPAYQQCNFQNVVAQGLQGSGKYGFNFESLITSTVDTCMAVGCANGFYLNGAVGGAYGSVNTSVTFLNCYANMNTNGVNGYVCLDSSYISFVSCACDYSNASSGTAYTISGSSSVSLVACGCELANSITLTNGWEVTACQGVGIYDCLIFHSKSTVDVYITGTSTGVHVFGFIDNNSISGATGLKVDSGSVVTVGDCNWTAAATPITNSGVLTNLNAGGGTMVVGGDMQAPHVFATNTNGTDYTELSNSGDFGFLTTTKNLVVNNGATFTTTVSGATNPQFNVQNNTAHFNSVSVYNDDLNGFITTSDNTGAAGSLTLQPARNLILAPTSTVTVNNAVNIAFATTTGTKIGTVGGASGQKIGFWNATPIVQPLLATGAGHTVDDVITILQNLGLVRQT